MRSFKIVPATSALLLCALMASEGAIARERYELGYFLGRTNVAAVFLQRLQACPTAQVPQVRMESTGIITTKIFPDYDFFIRVDASSHFLVKRLTELTLASDGTLKSINATVEGQGGDVLASLIKTSAFAATVAMGVPAPIPALHGAQKEPSPPSPPLIVCRPEISKRIAERDAVADNISNLERRQAVSGLTATETEALAAAKLSLAALDNSLTLTAKATRIGDNGKDGEVWIEPLDYGEWFDLSRSDPAQLRALPASAGAKLAWKVDKKALSALNSAAATSKLVSSLQPEAAIYYRRPVPVAVKLSPYKLNAAGAKVEDDSVGAAGIAAEKQVALLQLSGLFRLQIGRGGLFGSREIGVTFDDTGAPTMLKYGSASGGADIAKVIDAGRDAGTTLRDARNDGLKREVDELTYQKSLRELRAELSKTDH